MARLALSPVPADWLVVLLLLLPAGEMVPEAQIKDLYRNPEGSTCSQIWQHPRFMAKKRGSTVTIECFMKILGNVNWLRKQAADSEPKLLHLEQGHIEQTQSATNATLIIRNIQYQDNGIYFCQQECPEGSPERGCGTELRVMGFSTLAQLKRRNTLKDSIILIQTLLIIVFIIVPIFLLLDKDDHKAGMEEDHTYEGLNIDQTATYEDIVTLRTGEVKWSVGEHPGQE
ncbi:B-cell antigen receptor complex-associated protein beta chain [Pteropus alecto]|uniref:B-cell antigen receptor complex-associated protein beta chain n=1 Tax=Pteropus alecto TaxID=9402 RepID=UPI0003F0F6F7|nr:B-cell antigen receptor complex-associated protein beta chain [Pteropus alecto]XP_039715059.1 B-cell antigen receptor complex-associated protein beta chain isoform X1 [Pteropus giganteus]